MIDYELWRHLILNVEMIVRPVQSVPWMSFAERLLAHLPFFGNDSLTTLSYRATLSASIALMLIESTEIQEEDWKTTTI